MPVAGLNHINVRTPDFHATLGISARRARHARDCGAGRSITLRCPVRRPPMDRRYRETYTKLLELERPWTK